MSTAPSTTTGQYHKAIIGAVAGGIVAALAVLTGAMTVEDTFGDIPTVVWLSALSAFLVGAGVTGGSVAISKANAGAVPKGAGQPPEHP